MQKWNVIRYLLSCTRYLAGWQEGGMFKAENDKKRKQEFFSMKRGGLLTPVTGMLGDAGVSGSDVCCPCYESQPKRKIR